MFACTTIFITSLIYALQIISIPPENIGRIACFIDVGGSCTGCNEKDADPKEVCPEWTTSDVITVLQTIMKQIATVAAIFLVYALITLRYGIVLFRYVVRYQIEYV